MNFRKVLFIGIDAFLSFFIIMIALGLGLSFLKIQYYWFAFLIIDGAVSVTILIFMNKAFIKLIKKSENKNQDNEEIEGEESKEQEREQSKEPEIKEKNEVKERRYIPKKVRIAITVPILIVGIFIFLEIMFHLASFKGNSVFIPIISGVILLFALIFFPLRWYSSYDDEEYETNETVREENEVENNEPENEEQQENIVEEEPSRYVLKDFGNDWKNIPLLMPEKERITSRSIFPRQHYEDSPNWELKIMLEDISLFDSDIQDDPFFNKIRDAERRVYNKAWRYPRISSKDFPDPEELFGINTERMKKIIEHDEKIISEKVPKKSKKGGETNG